jgi:hypothetical protein
LDGSYPYTRMLQNQIVGKNNSWAIRWYASAFLQNKLTLYPGRSLVHNIGLDGSGTHCSEMEGYAGKLANYPIFVESIAVEENSLARQAIVNFHKQTRSSLHMKVANKLFAKIQKLRTIWHDKTI